MFHVFAFVLCVDDLYGVLYEGKKEKEVGGGGGGGGGNASWR